MNPEFECQLGEGDWASKKFSDRIGHVSRGSPVAMGRARFGSLVRSPAEWRHERVISISLSISIGLKKTRSTLRSIDFAMELEALLGRHVDVVTKDSLHWFIQPQVVAEAVPL
jgi:predicted nucleotidyltransferase